MKLTNVKWKQFENFESFLRLQSLKVFNGVIEILTIVLFIEKRKDWVSDIKENIGNNRKPLRDHFAKIFNDKTRGYKFETS